MNSVTWFFADALWMIELHNFAIPLMGLTIFSGLCLLYVEKRLPVIFINLAINAWIMMNTMWIVSEIEGLQHIKSYSHLAFAFGVTFIALACVTSKSIRETFSHFRRFRILKIK